jgi:hypothetical protein
MGALVKQLALIPGSAREPEKNRICGEYFAYTGDSLSKCLTVCVQPVFSPLNAAY